MPLRDVTSVVFDRGNGPFNEAAALEAYHLIAKMDDDEAGEFVFHVVNEVVENTIVENRDLVQKHLDRTIAKALVYTDLDAVAAGLNAEERQEVKKQLLSAVSKASEAQEAAWKHRDKTGQFKSFEHPVPKGGLSATTGKTLEIPEHPTDWSKMDEGHRAAYRAQYLGIVQALESHGGFDGNNDVRLHYTSGEDHPILAANPRQIAAAINPHKDENVEKVTIRPYKPTVGDQVADLTRSLGAGAATGLQTVGGDRANMGNQGTSGFVDQWYSASPTNNQQMYNRIGAGSQLLGQVGGPKLKVAAQFGGLVGQHGAQAENVFGPPVRQMAYRYRGTERKPDAELTQSYGDAIMRAKQGGAMPNRQAGEDVGDYQRRVAAGHAGRAPTWGERQAGRDAIVEWLQSPARAPRKDLSALQLASGHTPPSQGVLLNADGQIVTTAVGAADDWYLPFNLKHLGSLKGGEYIRSRSTGGLTTEDVYTGLMTGARRVTVVSRSGIYSMEFDPELRGGRRNNDKALRMSKRYGELLDAVQSGKVERQNISPEIMLEVKGTVDEMYPEGSITPAEREGAVQTLLQERKEHPEKIEQAITALDRRRVDLERDQNRELTPDEKADFEKDRFALLKQKEYFHKLNGLGYQAAQDALKEQFPYYIASTDARFKVGRSAPFGSNDKGYVEPGALRPTAARANLYGGAQGSGQKQHGFQSARTAGRAVPIVDRYGRPPADADAADRSPEEPKSPSGGGGAGMPIARATSESLAAKVEHEQAKQTAAVEVHAGMGTWVRDLTIDNGGKVEPTAESAAARKYADMDKTQFAVAMLTPGAPDEFFKAVKEALVRHPGHEANIPGGAAMLKVMDPEAGGAYSDDAAMVAPEAIYDFPDISAPEKVAAGQQLLALNPAKKAAEATPEELLREAQMRAEVLKSTAYAPEGTPDDQKYAVVNSVLSRAGLMPEGPAGEAMVKLYVKKPDDARASLKKIQIVRAAKQGEVSMESLLSLPQRKHPSGRDFTPEERAAGEFDDGSGRMQEI